jgi:hypothetical protein
MSPDLLLLMSARSTNSTASNSKELSSLVS